MIDIVCKYGNEEAFFNRLMSLGLSINEEPRRTEDRIERVNTPTLTDVNGDNYLTFRCTAEKADKLPSQGNNPAFTLLWRSDEYLDEESGTLHPWPMVEVQTYDMDGNPDGTRMQGVGRIR